MGLVRKAINGLFKGVTRQEDSNRLEGQVEESINMNHSVERGVSRRNPTELLANIGVVPDDAFTHSYVRGDGVEEYIILIHTGEVFVYTSAGVPVVVNQDADALNYLNVSGGKHNILFRALTVGDNTFILNKSIECEMDVILDGAVDDELNNPFYWAKKSFDNGQNVGYDYTLDGQTVNSTKTTSAVSALVTALGIDYVAYGSVIVRKNKPLTFIHSDSFGGQASGGFWGTAKSVNDLPRTMSGAEEDYDFIVKIQGDPDNQYTTFWVKFEDEHWKETRQPAMANTIKKDTMPIRLRREANGEFSLTTIDYDKREKGDEKTASLPSFIGNSLSDLFFFKNRLCLVSNENVIMSETASYFNYFPTTVTDILDSDPIDVAVDSNTVSLLNHAIPFNNSVVLLSNNAQFSLQAHKVLSPNDVSIASTTSYDATKNIRPVALGNSVYFLSDSANNTSLREYFVSDSGQSNTAIDVSGHVKDYIPKGIASMTGNTNEDIIFILPEDERDTLYVYKFFNDGQERIQTAWSKWQFGGDIANITILEDYLYLLIDRGAGICIEKLDYSSSLHDGDYLDAGSDEYESSITISEPVLKDGEGRLIQSARAPLMYKTFTVVGADSSEYEVEITDKLRTRIAKGYAVKDNKITVQGKTREVSIKVQSVEGNPLEFHTYAVELNYNMRADIV